MSDTPRTDAAPQPSTAQPEPAPSQGGVVRGDAAVAAPRCNTDDLRALAAMICANDSPSVGPGNAAKAINDAADEIDRLCTTLEEWKQTAYRAAGQDPYPPYRRATAFDLEAEANDYHLTKLRDEGECKSCIGDKCVTGPDCVAASNPKRTS